MSQLRRWGPRPAPVRPNYWIDTYPNYWSDSPPDRGATGAGFGASSFVQGERGVRESLAPMTEAAPSLTSSTSLHAPSAYRSEPHDTATAMANGWALVISVIIVGAFSAAAWFLAPNGETKTIWRSSLVLAAWSMWLMWAITFLAQWHPLITPERSDLRPEYVNRASSSAKMI